MIGLLRGGNESFWVVRSSGATMMRKKPILAATPPLIRVLAPLPAHRPPSFRENGIAEFVTSCSCGAIGRTPSDGLGPDQNKELVDLTIGNAGPVPLSSSSRDRKRG